LSGNHPEQLLGEMIELAEQLGIEVRQSSMGGAGGGLATLRGRRILFVDLDAPVEFRLDRAADGLATLGDELETIYVRPALRELIGGEPDSS
jgi:hypothetical protein